MSELIIRRLLPCSLTDEEIAQPVNERQILSTVFEVGGHIQESHVDKTGVRIINKFKMTEISLVILDELT